MLRTLPHADKAYYLKVSPSSIKSAFDEDEGCPRKAFYSQVLGHWQPARQSSAIGVQVHTAIENGLTGKDVNVHGTRLGAIASAAIATVPNPESPNWVVELRCDEPCHPEVPFTCRIDLLNREDFVIRDWKTTSSKTFHHALTVADLSEDVQLLSNAYVAFKKEKPPLVGVEHGNVYVGAGKPRVEVVPSMTTWSQVEDIWHGKVVPAATMLYKLYKVAVPDGELPQMIHAERVPYGNAAACTTYNRPCAFTEICSACPASRAQTRLPNMEHVLK